MNIFKKISLFNKITKAIDEAQKMIERNQGLAQEVKKAVKCLVDDIEKLVALLPMFKKVWKEIKSIAKI